MNANQFVQLLRELPKLVAEIDHSDTLQSGAAIVEKSIRGNFSRQEDASGRRWRPRQVTIFPDEIRSRWDHPLLILTGKLIGAATGGLGHKRTVSKSRLTMGIDENTVPYAPIHNFGGISILPNGRRMLIPDRQFFYLYKSDRRTLRKMVVARTRVKVLDKIKQRVRSL